TALKPAAPPPPPLPKLADEDMPLGLSQKVAPASDGSPAGLNLSGLKMPGSTPPPIPLKIDLSGMMDSPVPLKLDKIPPAPIFAIQLDIPEASPPAIPGPNKHKPTPATPTATTAPIAPPSLGEFTAGPINIASAPDQIEAAANEDACLAWFFKQVRSRYSACIALLYNKNSLQTWKWDSSLTPKNNGTIVTFDTPSLFRIAARTMRSYHGYVVDNPTHQSFFQSWGMARAPVHVTGVPIVVGGTFRGLFVCTANEPQGADTLEFLERMADVTVMRLEKVKGILSTAKAA
ncbi:MAG: hypothetical protein ABSF34_20360, partial [Verrucomicrobiota bacterium]